MSNQKFTGNDQVTGRCCSRPRHFCAGVDVPALLLGNYLFKPQSTYQQKFDFRQRIYLKRFRRVF